MAAKRKYEDKEIIGKVFDSIHYGRFEVLEKTQKGYKVKFLNTNYISDFNKYQVLDGAIRDKKVPFVQTSKII